MTIVIELGAGGSQPEKILTLLPAPGSEEPVLEFCLSGHAIAKLRSAGVAADGETAADRRLKRAFWDALSAIVAEWGEVHRSEAWRFEMMVSPQEARAMMAIVQLLKGEKYEKAVFS